MIDIRLFGDVVASEWTKLRSVRSTYWSLFATVIVGVGLSAAICAGNAHSYSSMTLEQKLTFDPTSLSLAGFFFAQLALGVFAIITMSAEYSTGTIRTSLAAVPQRGYVLSAKALVVGVTSLVVGFGTAFASFYVGQLIFARHNLNASLGDPGVMRAVIGSALYVGGLSLFALALATIMRHTAGAITTLTGIVFLLPIVSQLLPDSWQVNGARYLPANAGSAITNVVQVSDSLGPWTGFGVFLIWVVGLLAVAWYLLRRRDV
jgi:ABC-2 type transport system permease protein